MQIKTLFNFLFIFSFHSRDGKALDRFLQDYFDGKLKRYMKSEPIPENNDGPVKVRATVWYQENTGPPHA